MGFAGDRKAIFACSLVLIQGQRFGYVYRERELSPGASKEYAVNIGFFDRMCRRGPDVDFETKKSSQAQIS